ncbi:GumC family protein [Gloeobacter violaceus]|uniref:Gll1796 protein n=1 Tax=Gloeobacter violaceus (strain ATCC 29082 / PCC 7421) TaxID=251221 RepID=Q7NJN6_GLOVI|nr:tyrosine-protein kinase domain-containing protein [Gloeobacter violaceus]BAC89737.1 gll1796 [Gloeobacter violaceus PCC 7421]
MSSIVAIGRRHWRPLLALNTVLLAATVGIAVFYPRTWTASAQLILPNASSNLSANLGPLGNIQQQGLPFSNELNPTSIQSNILLSSDVLRPVWQKDPERTEKFTRLDTYGKLFKGKPGDQSTIVQLEAKGSSPELAQQRAEWVLQSYQTRLNALRLDDARRRDEFSRVETAKAQNNLQTAQVELYGYQRRTGLVNADDQTRGIVETLNSLRSTQTLTLAQAEAAARRATALEQAVGMDLRRATAALNLGEDKGLQALRQRLADIESQLAQARGLYTGKNLRVKSLELQREELLGKIKQQVGSIVPDASKVNVSLGGNSYRDSRIDLILQLVQSQAENGALTNQAARIGEKAASLEERLRTLAPQQSRLKELQRRYEIAEGIYRGLVAQVQQAKVNAFDAYPNVQILDAPSVDSKPSPSGLLVAVGGLVAMLSGSIALALWLERRNPMLGVRELDSTGLPVLGRIPKLKDAALSAAEAEEFRQLASVVSLLPLPARRLMITSANTGEGKTTVTLGLAKALRELGFRVLVVDADFRQAGLGRKLQVGPGSEPVALAPSLSFLPAGRPDERTSVGEYIARGHFSRYLSELESAGGYDYVLIDTAPEDLVAETKLIAAAIGNVLFVVRPGVSNRDEVNASLAALQRFGSSVHLVINGGESAKGSYRYRYERPALASSSES